MKLDIILHHKSDHILCLVTQCATKSLIQNFGFWLIGSGSPDPLFFCALIFPIFAGKNNPIKYDQAED